MRGLTCGGACLPESGADVALWTVAGKVPAMNCETTGRTLLGAASSAKDATTARTNNNSDHLQGQPWGVHKAPGAWRPPCCSRCRLARLCLLPTWQCVQPAGASASRCRGAQPSKPQVAQRFWRALLLVRSKTVKAGGLPRGHETEQDLGVGALTKSPAVAGAG
jgi:hypothetical protein